MWIVENLYQNICESCVVHVALEHQHLIHFLLRRWIKLEQLDVLVIDGGEEVVVPLTAEQSDLKDVFVMCPESDLDYVVHMSTGR